MRPEHEEGAPEEDARSRPSPGDEYSGVAMLLARIERNARDPRWGGLKNRRKWNDFAFRGEHLAQKLRKHDLTFFDYPLPPPEESEAEAEIRLHGRNVSLWTAYLLLLAKPTPSLSYGLLDARCVKALEREYRRILVGGESFSATHRRKVRRSYNRKREPGEPTWNELPAWRQNEILKEKLSQIAAGSAPETTPEIPADWLEQLSPAEIQGMEAILNDEPVRDEADKSRRRRAREKMRQLLEEGP
jgi:hypothetical protein